MTVTQRGDGFGGVLPVVNVKVYNAFGLESNEALMRQVAQDQGPDDDVEAFVSFAKEWIETHEDDWSLFGMACESGYEQLELDVSGESGYVPEWRAGKTKTAGFFPGHGVKLEVQGRSGGWIAVRGLPPVEEWGKGLHREWADFERTARAQADDVPYSMLAILYLNDFDSYMRPDRIATSVVGECVVCGGPGVAS